MCTCCGQSLDIKIFYILRMRLDKLFSWGDLGTHEDIEYFVGSLGIFDRYLFEQAIFRIHRRFPELVRIHFSETFVALDVQFGR